MLTHVSLFTGGVAGFDIAAELAGFTTIGQVEIDEYNIALLEKHWPNVPKWRDIHNVTAEEVRSVTGIEHPTLLSAGVPCQPASVAGKRRGAADDRWLWPEALRIVAELQPCWVCFENPTGILTMGIEDIVLQLESLQYEVGPPIVLPASAVYAPHQRYRVFVVGHLLLADHNDAGSRAPEYAIEQDDAPKNEGWQNGLHDRTSRRGDSVAQSKRGRSSFAGDVRECSNTPTGRVGQTTGVVNAGRWSTKSGLGGLPDGTASWLDRLWPSLRGEEEQTWEPPRCAKGVKNRKQRLTALGNSVVWKQCYPILKAIADYENGRLQIGKENS